MGFSASSSKNKSKQESTSSSLNQAYPFIQSTFAPETAYTGQSNNAIASLLGLNGEAGQTEGFDNFRKSSGYDFVQDQGTQGIEASQASKGLLGSGSTLKGITNFSSNLANSFLSQYLSNLGSLGDRGLQAGQLIAGAGNTSNSQSSGSSSGSSFGLSVTGKK
jgi:hypothetical protein